MSAEVKMKHMGEWWGTNLSDFVTVGFLDSDFAEMTLGSKLLFREGMHEMLGLTGRFEIPCLIVSGGISEIIEASVEALLETHEDGDYAGALYGWNE